MKSQILKILKGNTQQYISGEVLSHQLGISRTAIWKYITMLRKEGYYIASSSKKGYRLETIPNILSKEEVQDGLDTIWIGKNIHCYESITSTNTIAKELAAKGCEAGTVVIADQQTMGKGRRGRHWESPAGTGIWMSIVLRPNISPTEAPFLTILTALAVAKAIEEFVDVKPGIKWPNDIIIGNKKACGILTEMNAEIEMVNYVVIGIGINVNMNEEDFPQDIQAVATSLKEAIGKEVSRKLLLQSVLCKIEELYIQSIDEKIKSTLIEEYKKYSVTLGHKVKVIYPHRELEGEAMDLTSDGELIIKTSEGQTERIFSGEVSVRGILGYV